MTDQIIFDTSVDGLLRAVRSDLSPRCKDKLRTTGLDVDAKLQPGYPALVWAECVRIIADDLYPGTLPAEAHRKVGKRTVTAFVQGKMGIAVFTLLRLLGPDRTIGRMTRNLRTGSNFVDTRSTAIGPHQYEIWINDVSGVPGFYQGLLESGLEHVGARAPLATMVKTEGAAWTFHVRWNG